MAGTPNSCLERCLHRKSARFVRLLSFLGCVHAGVFAWQAQDFGCLDLILQGRRIDFEVEHAPHFISSCSKCRPRGARSVWRASDRSRCGSAVISCALHRSCCGAALMLHRLHNPYGSLARVAACQAALVKMPSLVLAALAYPLRTLRASSRSRYSSAPILTSSCQESSAEILQKSSRGYLALVLRRDLRKQSRAGPARIFLQETL